MAASKCQRRQGWSQARLQKEGGPLPNRPEPAFWGNGAWNCIDPNRSTSHIQDTARGTQDASEKWTTVQGNIRISLKVAINIGVWNVRKGHHVGQNEIIVQEIQRWNIQIAALSELRLMGSGTTSIKPSSSNEPMTLYYSGVEKC